MTPERRAAAEARCAALPEESWSAHFEESGLNGSRPKIRASVEPDVCGCWQADDLIARDPDSRADLVRRVRSEWDAIRAKFQFIAHARTDLPDALDLLDAKDAEIARLESLLRAHGIDPAPPQSREWHPMDTGRRLRDAEPGARELWMGTNAYRIYRERYGDGRSPHPLLAGVPVYLDAEIPPDQVVTHCPELIETMGQWGPALVRDEGAPLVFRG